MCVCRILIESATSELNISTLSSMVIVPFFALSLCGVVVIADLMGWMFLLFSWYGMLFGFE